MDKLLAARLDPKSPYYDGTLCDKLKKIANDYIEAGLSSLNYYVPDFDAANDLVNCYAPVTRADFEKRDRNSPQSFVHPMTATEITTLATFVSQILFGTSSSRRVEARSDGDEEAAQAVNELLQWNDDQQATYLQGYLWLWDCLSFNRGIMYERWKPIFKTGMEEVQEDDFLAEQIPVMRDDGKGQKMRKGEPVYGFPKISRWRKTKVESGGYTHIDLVSPYDFICDPEFSLMRFQEGRFAGHRLKIAYNELKRRSELAPEHADYVIPAAVAKLKKGKPGDSLALQYGGTTGNSTSSSRSFHERNRSAGVNPAAIGSSGSVNKEDGGVIECFSLTVRISPKSIGLYEEDENDELIEVLMAGKELLSFQVLTNEHDEFSYNPTEARPNAHRQFGPSWALIVKPIQDHVDYLKRRHMESLARTSGNIFIGDPTKVDFEAFTDPSKDGLFIPIKPGAEGTPLDQLVKQVAVTDTTARFYDEMNMWIDHGENATGAHSFVQGNTEDPEQTATQFAGTQQMATGRISSIARLCSVQGIVPQTRRIVSNFKQFMPEQVVVRITGDDENLDPETPPRKFMTINRSDIQHEFDVVAHDGSLPGSDMRKVAALTKMLDAAQVPVFQQFFDPTIPGSLDAKKILFEIAKAGGMPVKNFLITRESAVKNLMNRNMANGMGAGGVPPQPPGVTPTEGGPPPPAPPAPPELPVAGTNITPMPGASGPPLTPPVVSAAV